MNKFCSILLALFCIAVLFSGCASKGNSGTGGDGGNGQTPPEQTEDTYTYEEQIADAQAIHKNLMNAYFGIQEPTPSASALAYSAEKERSFEDMLEEICDDQELTEEEMKSIYSAYFLLSYPLNELLKMQGKECFSNSYTMEYAWDKQSSDASFLPSDVLPTYIEFEGVYKEKGTKYVLAYIKYPDRGHGTLTMQGQGYFKCYFKSNNDYGFEVSLFDYDDEGEVVWGSMYSVHKAKTKTSVCVLYTELSREPWETTYFLNNKIEWRIHWDVLSDELKAATPEYLAAKNEELKKDIGKVKEQNKIDENQKLPNKNIFLEVDYKLFEATVF